MMAEIRALVTERTLGEVKLNTKETAALVFEFGSTLDATRLMADKIKKRFALKPMGERASPSCGTILRHFTLHNYLVVYAITWYQQLSRLAAAAMRACGCSFLPSATD